LPSGNNPATLLKFSEGIGLKFIFQIPDVFECWWKEALGNEQAFCPFPGNPVGPFNPGKNRKRNFGTL
jgi:hypothetical protein